MISISRVVGSHVARTTLLETAALKPSAIWYLILALFCLRKKGYRGDFFYLWLGRLMEIMLLWIQTLNFLTQVSHRLTVWSWVFWVLIFLVCKIRYCLLLVLWRLNVWGARHHSWHGDDPINSCCKWNYWNFYHFPIASKK